MKSNEVLNQIKTVLGIDLEKKEIKLESLKLENGTVENYSYINSNKKIYA